MRNNREVLLRKHEEAKRSPITFIFYFSLTNHDDHPDPIFWQLYLGPQLRYKPSAASTLSPAPVAIDWCPPILYKPNPTTELQTTKRMLWCCFHSIHFTDGHPSTPHRCWIVLRSGRCDLRDDGKFACSKSVFLCAKNNKKYYQKQHRVELWS
jgi:hypothetical protein